jgi:hypothetical protein
MNDAGFQDSAATGYRGEPGGAALERSQTERKRKRARRLPWENWSDRELLETRLCDLGVTLEESRLAKPIRSVCRELEARNLRIRPSFWLSDDWFSPEGVVGVALPFFLAHPRLMRLERRHMLEVEGGTVPQCTKLLRHELGHAVQHAFDLHRRPRWRAHFGSSSRPYPEYYRPNPASRRFVLHLAYWYAQAHPDEDFAETFAIWLTPGSRWRKRYAGWPALRKLTYVDELMSELAGRAPRARSRARVEPLGKLRHTLHEYYEAKRERYSGVENNIYDADLRRLFAERTGRASNETAASFLRRNGPRIRRMVARGTGKREYALEVVLRDMIARCRELALRIDGREEDVLMDFAILLAARSVEYVYRGREWHAL